MNNSIVQRANQLGQEINDYETARAVFDIFRQILIEERNIQQLKAARQFHVGERVQFTENRTIKGLGWYGKGYNREDKSYYCDSENRYRKLESIAYTYSEK